MSLSDDELRRLEERAALKEEILAELKKESIKAEILGEIQPPPAKKNLIENPLFLLLLGFILTGILGSWFASHWQSRQWENQQKQLAQQRSIEQKYALTEKMTKSVAEAYVALEDVIYLADTGRNIKSSDTKAPERATNLIPQSRNWRVTEEILQRDLKVNFRNQKIQSLFAEIRDNWDTANNDLKFVLRVLENKNWKRIEDTDTIEINKTKHKISEFRDDAFKKIKEMSKQAQELMQLMLDETEEDVKSSQIFN